MRKLGLELKMCILKWALLVFLLPEMTVCVSFTAVVPLYAWHSESVCCHSYNACAGVCVPHIR